MVHWHNQLVTCWRACSDSLAETQQLPWSSSIVGEELMMTVWKDFWFKWNFLVQTKKTCKARSKCKEGVTTVSLSWIWRQELLLCAPLSWKIHQCVCVNVQSYLGFKASQKTKGCIENIETKMVSFKLKEILIEIAFFGGRGNCHMRWFVFPHLFFRHRGKWCGPFVYSSNGLQPFSCMWMV